MENPAELLRVGYNEWMPSGVEDDLIIPRIPHLNELPDDARFRIFNNQIPRDQWPAHRIFTADPAELPGIVEEFTAAAAGDWGLDEATQQAYLESAARHFPHEAQHGETSTLFAGDVLYSVGISANRNEGVVNWTMETHAIGELTKLEAAASVAHPEWLSPGDLDIGYSGIEDVALRAAEQGLPLPLSYQLQLGEDFAAG